MAWFGKGEDPGKALALVFKEIQRLHGGLVDEVRARLDHLKSHADDSLKLLNEACGQAARLEEVMNARTDQIGSLAADVDRFEARIAEVESQLASLRAAILVGGLPPSGAG